MTLPTVVSPPTTVVAVVSSAPTSATQNLRASIASLHLGHAQRAGDRNQDPQCEAEGEETDLARLDASGSEQEADESGDVENQDHGAPLVGVGGGSTTHATIETVCRLDSVKVMVSRWVPTPHTGPAGPCGPTAPCS